MCHSCTGYAAASFCMPTATLCYSKVSNILLQCLAILIHGPCFQHFGSGALVYVGFLPSWVLSSSLFPTALSIIILFCDC